ncbi:MAG: NAD(+) synthase [Corallococcus sp.]|nr:NAD(+) synthase [Corallococcus sp.]MCM1360151.1 NAD(+) synthase [Corallococcus sp.]MCM1395748.1 NAD(+) synthase [Corallococcus sp.]
MNNEKLVKKLNALKKQQRLTLAQLANKSGLTLGTVNKIMSGALLDIKADKLQKLCTALGVLPKDVLGDAEPDNARTTAETNFLGLVKIACVSPEVRVADCEFNVIKIVESAKHASQDGAKIILFPELCITAYSCGDLFFQSALREAAKRGLAEICDSLRDLPAVVVVGLPIADVSGKLYNVAAVVFRGEVLAFVPKSNLPNYNEFYEKRLFAPAPQFETTAEFFGKQVPLATDIIFADSAHSSVRFSIEICEDIWVANSPSFRHANAGANLILNLSASDEIVTKDIYRRKMVEIQSAKAGVIYAYCSCNDGESTSEVVFGGHNIICENGAVIAESKPFGKGYAIAEADFEFIDNERVRLSKSNAEDNYKIIPFDLPIFDKTTRNYDRHPFVPADKKVRAERCEEILNLQAHALKKRVQHVNAGKLVIGVSGGSDSTLALIVCKRALDLLGKDAKDIIAVSMPCFGTTARTLNNSVALAKAIGASVQKIDITKAVTQHLSDIGHSITKHDVTFENAQARERTQVLMDIANSENGLVIGTGDMSELALGWSTFNGDHMSMYSVNGSVPKTMVKALLAHVANGADEPLKSTICDVLATPISPELLPAKPGEAQITEDIVGPYELHDYFIYMLVRKGFSPSKVFTLAQISFKGTYDAKTIYKWLDKFIRRFFSQQFKRSCLPDGVKLGTVDLSKNGWRMPSDACCASWLADLERVNPER